MSLIDKPEPGNVVVRLTLEVEYAPEGESVEALKNKLADLARFASNRGLLTPDGGPAFCASWDYLVEEVKAV